MIGVMLIGNHDVTHVVKITKKIYVFLKLNFLMKITHKDSDLGSIVKTP
jgi:hypothetical protein